ncbi:WAT1-related protein At1g43650-like [Andrographis paniculata]|uniref:WAT1-related protein At1g43650-like n=1 Tax=Andrographis paniculata TaxID=175694 RepID=UPI0021E74291|nr:WAT1-related protein At1g43650-like [Andrographis paniculata]
MGIMKKHMPLTAMVVCQLIFTAMFLLSKAAISSGMKPSIFVAYRQAVATLFLAPFAYFSHRKTSPRLTLPLLCKIFIVSSCGMGLSLNLQYAGLKYVSPTFTTVANNTVPGMVFIIALCLRMERVSMSEKQGLAKLMGSILCLSGAMIFTLYKGPELYTPNANANANSHSNAYANEDPSFSLSYTKQQSIIGSVLVLCAFFIWAVWLIIQTPILKEYPAALRLTTLQCGFSCVTSAAYAAAVERHAPSWKLAWNLNLFTLIYCGILVTGVTYSLQVWVVETRGPVFTAIFSPLSLILTAIFSALIFHESLHWGSVLGGMLLVCGLYGFLWGKYREGQTEVAPSTDGVRLESVVVTSQPSDHILHQKNASRA